MDDKLKQLIIGEYWNGISMWTISIQRDLDLQLVRDVIQNDPTFSYICEQRAR